MSPVTSGWLLGLGSVFNYSWYSLLMSDEKWDLGGKVSCEATVIRLMHITIAPHMTFPDVQKHG